MLNFVGNGNQEQLLLWRPVLLGWCPTRNTSGVGLRKFSENINQKGHV
jgi:hypothetical protein